MISITFNRSISRSIAATIKVGIINGKVRYRNRCHAVAPSTTAASNGSIGRADSPAMQMSATIGVHIQASTATRVGTTQLVSESHSGGVSMPITANKYRTIPNDGSSMTTHTSPIATVVGTLGKIRSAR